MTKYEKVILWYPLQEPNVPVTCQKNNRSTWVCIGCPKPSHFHGRRRGAACSSRRRYRRPRAWGRESTGCTRAARSGGLSVFSCGAREQSRWGLAAPLGWQTSPFLLFTPITSSSLHRLLMAQGVGLTVCPCCVLESDWLLWECCFHEQWELQTSYVYQHNTFSQDIYVNNFKVNFTFYIQIS